MTQSLHPAAQKGFSSAAELYQQVRPSYPQDIVNWLRDQLQLGEQSQVIDLGSGTGKFLPYLKQLSSHIIAVEPIQAMLAQLQHSHPNIQTLQATSEKLPLAAHSIDAVICAQSFHWFANLEALTQIHQVLKPSGHLALIWNQRDVQVDWVKALADRIQPLEGHTPRYHSGQWQKVFEQQTLFQLADTQTFRQQHVGTVEQVVSKRLLSTSFIAAMSEDEQQQLKAEFEQIVLQNTGKHPQDEIAFPYVTYAYDFKKLIRNKGTIMKPFQLKYFGLPVLLCSNMLLVACDHSKNSSAQNDKNQPEDKVMQELITEPVKVFQKTPDDLHDLGILTDFDQRFTQMSDEMEDELVKMQEQGSLTDEFAHNRKRDNIQSALNMLKALDLKTQQGRYIQGLMAEYWQSQAKLYDEHKEGKVDPMKNSAQQFKGLSEFLHAQEQLEHWQSQYPEMNKAAAAKTEASKTETQKPAT